MPNEVPSYFEPPVREQQRNVQAATPRVPDPTVVNATVASRTHEVTLRYPWVKPDVALAIARSKFDLGSKQVVDMAGAAATSKKKRGFNWLSPGDWVDKGATAAKATTRTAALVGQFGGEAVATEVRNLANSALGAHNPQAHGGSDNFKAGTEQADVTKSTSLGVALRKLVTGQKVDLGTGFFVGGEVHREQAAAAQKELAIKNPDVEGGYSAATLGRILAVNVTEPGSVQNKILSGGIDAAVAWYADPTQRVLKLGSEAAEASRTFGASRVLSSSKVASGVEAVSEQAQKYPEIQRILDAGGAINGSARKSVIPQKVGQWLDGRGSQLLDHIAADNNARHIWERLPGVTPQEAVQLAEASTPEDARSVLEPLLGLSIREKPSYGFTGALPERMRRTIGQVRILGTMPGRHVDANDANEVARETINWLRNAKASPEAIDATFNQIGRAHSTIGRAQAVFDAFDRGYEAMLGAGVQDRAARVAARAFTEGRVDAGKYFIDNIGHNVGVLGATINGDHLATAHPQLITEYLDHAIPLPDARTVRRLVSPFRPMLAKIDSETGVTLPRVPLAAIDFVFNKVWRTATIARPALAVRILGETQLRMGAVGLDAAFSHPFETMAWIVGRKGDALGSEFSALDDLSKFAKTMTSRRSFMGEGTLSRGWDVVKRGEPDYAKGLAAELNQLHADPIARRIAGGWSEGDRVAGGLTGNHVSDAKNWFWSGEPGKTLRLQLAEDTVKTDLATSRSSADRYIDEVFQRVQLKTSEHPDLLDVVQTGEHNGEHILGEGNPDRDGVSRDFMRFLNTLTEDTGDAAGNVGPAMVKTPKLVRNSKNSQLFDAMDRAVGTVFHTIIGAPLDKTMYSPAFKQFYWRRMAELAQHATPEAKATILENAARFNIPDAIVKAIQRAPEGGAYSAEHLHVLAGSYASEESLKLLDDLTTKAQFADIGRNFFPFAEAWKDALRAWSKIATRNPATIRRFQQTLEGARNAGFFAPDPQTGEETFTFPLSGQITRTILGVDVPLTGRVGGLNIFSDSPLLPGFGPVVQLPVQKFLPDKPEYDALRRFVSPYGSESLGATFIPGWVSKASTGIRGSDGDRVFANTVKDVAASLYSSGDYDISTNDGVDHLLDDARVKARGLFLLRAVGQFAGPTSPSAQFRAKDKNGDVQLVNTMAERLQELRTEDRVARAQHKQLEGTANERFIAEFGSNALLFLQSKTQREGSGPVSQLGLNWVRDHQAVVSDYPDVYGFLAPQGPGFSFDAYNRLLRNGELRTLTPKEYVEAANARAASMIYTNVRDQLGVRGAASQQGTIMLHDLRAQLVKKFPGYTPGIVDTGRQVKQIDQLERAVQDKRLAKNDVAQAIKVYLEVRRSALGHLEAAGYLSLSSKAAAPFAARLRDVADKLVEQTPGFFDVYDQLFSHELGEAA